MSKKISVSTPDELYKLIRHRAIDLEMSHREYFLSLAIEDLVNRQLTEQDTERLKTVLEKLDQGMEDEVIIEIKKMLGR